MYEALETSKCEKGSKIIAEPKDRSVYGDGKLREQIGACGIYCGFCPVFNLEQNRCFGCEWLDKQLKKRGKHEGCVFWECTQNRNLKCCFQCKEFPCKTHYNPKRSVYTRGSLNSWKKLAKTGIPTST